MAKADTATVLSGVRSPGRVSNLRVEQQRREVPRPVDQNVEAPHSDAVVEAVVGAGVGEGFAQRHGHGQYCAQQRVTEPGVTSQDRMGAVQQLCDNPVQRAEDDTVETE